MFQVYSGHPVNQQNKSIVVIVLCILLMLTPLALAQNNGSISGSVRDAGTGNPLTGVNIIVKGTVLGAATDLEGEFRIENIASGAYDLQITMIGYKSITRTGIQISAGQNPEVIIELDETTIEAPELIVTASKRAQRVDDSPSSIAIMTSKDLEKRNQVYLDQLLEHVPGVNFMGSQVNIRGSSGFSYGVGSRVLLLVDGVPVMSSDTGEIKWDFIPASQVERVEIVKSAGSALYGSSALGGVINIITKSAALKPETNLRMSFGFYDDPPYDEWKWTNNLLYYNNVDVDHSRKIGDHNIFFSIGRHADEGYTENGEFERYNASGKVFLKLNSQSNLTLSGNYENNESGIGVMWRNRHNALEVEPAAVGDQVVSNRFSLNATHQWAVNKSFGLKNRVSWFRSQFENQMHDNNDYSTAHKLGYELQGNYILTETQSLTFGTEETLDLVSFVPLGDFDIITASIYAQDEIKLPVNLIMTLGLRYDYTTTNSDLTDYQLSPKFGLVWHIAEMTTFRLSSGKGFRAPSVTERFPNIYASGLKVVPNPELGAETAWSHEIGFSTPLSPSLLLDIAAFQNDYWDLIEPVPDITNTVRFMNLTRARISGMETIMKFSILNKFITGQFGYTYLDPQDLDMDEVLAYRPKHMLNTAASVHFRNMEFGIDYRYYSRLEKVKLYEDEPRVAQKVLNTHWSIDLNRYHISLNANNILNHMHTQHERTIMPIRHFTGAIKIKL